jgi:hypothetical protein
MNSIFQSLFGSPNNSTAGTPLSAAAQQINALMQDQEDAMLQKEKLYQSMLAAPPGHLFGLQHPHNGPPHKYTMTATQMLEWQKAQLATQEAKAAEERRRAREELEMPHNACSVSVAVDLWIVQFGDGWVYSGDVPTAANAGEMDWHALADRLLQTKHMEARRGHWRVMT